MNFLYASGYFGISLITQVVVSWLMFFYCPPTGSGRDILLPAITFGLVMALGRIVDAVTDPIVAILSDNTRSRFGRRRPFIAIGMGPVVLCFILLWLPPDLPPPQLAIYLGVVLAGLFTALTVVTCPFLALLPEITTSPAHRLKTSSHMAVFYMAGLACGFIGSAALIDTVGFGVMGITLGLLSLLGFFGPLLSVREMPSPDIGQRTRLLDSLSTVFSNKAFTSYILALPLFWFGFNIILMGLPYIVTLQLQLPASRAGYLLVLSLIVALVTMPVISRISLNQGKKRAFILTMTMCLILVALLPTIGMWPGIPPAIHGAILIAFAGVPIAGLFILPNALVADISDFSYRTMGIHQEALYFGIQGLILKATVGLSALALGILLDGFGYGFDGFQGILLIGPTAAISLAIGLLLFCRYPLR